MKNNKSKVYIISIILSILIIIPFLMLLQENAIGRKQLTSEDGFIENLSAFCFLMASLISFLTFFKSKTIEKKYALKMRKNYCFLLLGILFFFCFGEEISWGQRIFNVAATEEIKSINAQGETNLHNLNIFHSLDKNHKEKKGIALWVTSERIFGLFWLCFCLVVPFVFSYSSKLRDFMKRIHLPIVPIWLGIIFLLNYVISKIIEKKAMFLDNNPTVEVRETNFALLFMALMIYFYLNQNKNENQLNN